MGGSHLYDTSNLVGQDGSKETQLLIIDGHLKALVVKPRTSWGGWRAPSTYCYN